MVEGPDFVGIGMQRCGTTWIAGILQQHPGVLMRKKEVNFFVRHYGKGAGWYHDWFKDKGDRVAGEFSPNYMISPRPDPAHKELYPSWNPRRRIFFWMRERSARDELHKLYPDVRIMAVFRNPADRAWSAYWHWRRRKEKTGKRIVSFEQMWEDDGRWIKTIGLYADYLAYWQEVFPNLKVILHDDIVSDSAGVVKDVYRFVGVDETFKPEDTSRKNVGQYSEPMPDTLRNRVLDFYQSQIIQLSKMIGRDHSHWLRE